jgi:hypothetical protein
VATLSNTPDQPALLTLAARKSFSFTVQFLGENDTPLSLTDAEVSFTIGEQVYSATPILSQDAAEILPGQGLALFNLQASQLDLVPGVYPFEIVVTTLGYSAIAINGDLEIVESYDVDSLSDTYSEAPSTFGLIAHLQHNRLVVTSNSIVLQGPEGPQGPAGRDGNPFGQVLVTYNGDGRVATMTIDGQTTTYIYNIDGTIASDERDGVTRLYVYTDGNLTSIEPQD